MDHQERADEVEKEIGRLERESEKLGESTDQAKSDWEAAKADPTKAPGAADPEAAGPHHVDAEDPATGKKYGERRQEEIEATQMADAEEAENDDSGEVSGNDST
jgi:hypothetical protein